MRFFITLLAICAISSNVAQTKFTYIPAQSYVMGAENDGDFTHNVRTKTVSISAFEMSSQVTVAEYLAFVNEQRRLRGSKYANLLMPKKECFTTEDMYSKYIHDKAYQKEPIVGISWENAHEYIRWKNQHPVKDKNAKSPYRLPTESEWEGAYRHMTEQKNNDFGNVSDWTLSAYDESVYEFVQDLSSAYTYKAVECDPLVLKRKVIRGNSFLYSVDMPASHRTYGYKDSSYMHVGFRLVRSVYDRTNDFNKELIIDEKDSVDKKQTIDTDEMGLLYGAEISINFIVGDTLEMSSDKWTVKSVIKQGLFSGDYESHYKNGQLKAKGSYMFNQKVGVWDYYNDKGQLVLKRHYSNNYVYKRLYPLSEGLGGLLLDEPIFSMARTDHTTPYPYYHVLESNVYYTKRYWKRNVNVKEAWPVILEAITNGDIACYDPNNDQFAKQIPHDSIDLPSDFHQMVGFSLKGDFFFDKSHVNGDHRIIGIAPEIKEGDSTRLLCWIYFPEIRPFLAKQCVSNSYKKSYPSYIKNIDDIFHFDFYTGDIYRFSNIYGRDEPKEKDPILSKLELIEINHDLLIHMFNGKDASKK